jgi:predicted dehydrogenase
MNLVTRRSFAVCGAAAGAAILGGQSPNNKVVLALIGAGGRGTMLAGGMAAIENCEFKTICEVNDARGEPVMKKLEEIRGIRPGRAKDMRRVFEDKDIDGVVIATPEHWHALATVWACQAGKDVYVEKNVSHTIWEGRKMLEAARKYKRVVQCGTQNRSAPYAFTARDYIRSGKLGKVVHVKVYNLLPASAARPRQADQPVPPDVDWDAWLGPAPEAPYNPGVIRGWNSMWAYAGGSWGGDGIHQLDLARMALGDPPPPKAAYCAAGHFAYPEDASDAPDMQAITYNFGGFTMICESGHFSPYMKKFPPEVRFGQTWPLWPQSSCRIEIYGTNQLMYLGRHGAGWQVLEADGKVVGEEKGRFPDKDHQTNFVECIRSRKLPHGDIEQGHQSATVVHMGNIAHRVGNQRVVFDPATESFAGNEAANRMLRPAYRKHYRIPDSV